MSLNASPGKQRAVCYYHIDGEPVLQRDHGGGLVILTDDQSYTDWGSAWAWYERWADGFLPVGPWTRVEKPWGRK